LHHIFYIIHFSNKILSLLNNKTQVDFHHSGDFSCKHKGFAGLSERPRDFFTVEMLASKALLCYIEVIGFVFIFDKVCYEFS